MAQIISMEEFRRQQREAVRIVPGQRFPLPAPEVGVRMSLFDGRPFVLMAHNNITERDIEAFDDGIDHFSYLEAATTPPIALFSFPFQKDLGLVEVNFDAKRAEPVDIKRLFDTEVEEIFFVLLDRGNTAAIRKARLDNIGWAMFLSTLQKQVSITYDSHHFTTALYCLNNAFSIEEVRDMGTRCPVVWEKVI